MPLQNKHQCNVLPMLMLHKHQCNVAAVPLQHHHQGAMDLMLLPIIETRNNV